MVSAFSLEQRNSWMRNSPQDKLVFDIAQALSVASQDARSKILKSVVKIDEPVALADLMLKVPAQCRTAINARLAELIPSEAATVWTLPELQARVDAMLKTGNAVLAQLYVDEERAAKTLVKKVPGREVAHLRAKLQLHLIKGEWEEIMDAKPDPEMDRNELEQAREIINFFWGLAQLLGPQRNSSRAVHLFEQLVAKQPCVGSYVDNLFAAKLSELLGTNIFILLSGEKLVAGKKLMAEAERLDQSVLRNNEYREAYLFNRSLLLLALGQPMSAHQCLLGLESENNRAVLAAYTSVALERTGKRSEAFVKIEAAEREFGSEKTILAAREYLTGAASSSGDVNVVTYENIDESLRQVLAELVKMEPDQQAKVVMPIGARQPAGELNGMIFKLIREAAAAVVELVPRLKSYLHEGDENDINSLVSQLLSAKLAYLGWASSDQSTGGYSGSGGVGERDIVLSKNGVVLSVVEALRCANPVTWHTTINNLASHAQKLVGYADVTAFTHLTYCFVEGGVQAAIDTLQKIARFDMPEGFVLVDLWALPDYGALPRGFEAKYRRFDRYVDVLYLVLDMDQTLFSDAAAKAAATKSKRVGD